MSQLNRILIGALVLAGVAAPAARADDLADTIRALVDQVSPSLVRVEYVTRGFGMSTREISNSVTGIVVAGDGLIMAMDPVGGFLSMMGDAEAPPKPENVRVTTLRGEKFAADFVGRDDEVDASFYRVREPEKFSPPPLQLSRRVPQLAELIVVVDVLPESFSPPTVFAVSRVNSVLEKPTRSYTSSDLSLSLYYGAPVLTLDGEVIGVVGQETASGAVMDMDSMFGGMNSPWGLLSAFMPRVIPAATLEPLIQSPPTEEGTRKGWLGIIPQVLESETAEFIGVGESGGVLISKVFEDTPAERAGLKPEDIITHVDGAPVDVHREEHVPVFIRRIQRIEPGTLTKFTVLRDGKVMDIGVTIAEKPRLVAQAETLELEPLGLTVRELTLDTREAAKLPPETTGVVVNSVDPAGAAGIAEIEPGDVILEVDGLKVEGIQGFRDRIDSLRDQRKPETVFFVHRGGQTRFVKVKPEWEETP